MSKLDDAQKDFLTASLREIDYGSVVITVHDGQVTQIDTTVKKRFQKKASRLTNRNVESNLKTTKQF
ncbi:YezD family protein [Pseudogracilibacillus sp. SE30717A]|uniref:YezD family protein n=1 Tax=Pseudogracilibacillus sp. SE30717A TaxID=3098293 RepID=UPI00300E1C78